MASVYIGLKRGKEGFMESDFTVGAATSAAQEVEVRILDTITSRDDVVKLLKAIERYCEEKFFTGAIR